MDSSFYLTLLDEISLEGLDGITFPSLWIRLHERDKYLIKCGKKPLFLFDSEANLCETIFKILVKDVEKGHIGFYEFPTPRRKVFVFDRNKYFQSESGCFCFDNSAVPDDFQAPIVIIKQENSDIMGSCEDFDKRKDISQKIVSDVKNKKLKCYEDFQKSYKIDHVVIVASQNLRNQALLGHDRSWDVDLEIRPEHYVILESIGRKRWTGEMLFGKEAPVFKDAKIKSSYHYWRKYLSQHRLVFSITTSLHAKGRRQNFLTTIAYLPRFRPKILHPNDWKIVELSTIFIEKCQNKLSLEDLRQEFEKIQVTKPLTLKKIRSLLVRYQHIIKMHEDDKKSGVFLEYLRPLDQTLDYEDIYENRGNSLQSADETEQQVTAKPNKSGKKCPENLAETDADFEDEMIDDDPNSNVKEVDREDCDEYYSDDDDDDFISMNVGHSFDKTEWGDPETELENIDQSMDHDFDCEEFFNSESNFQIPLLPKARNQLGTDSKLASSSHNNGECKEVSVVPARQLIKFEILDRKLQKELRNLPRNKFICLQDGQILKISMLKIQQIHRNIKSKFIWLIKQIGPISRVRMINWFDWSNNILRSLIKQFENIGQLTHTVELRGRQSIFKYHTKCSNTTAQVDPDKQTDVIKTRINHVLETFQHQLYFDCFFILKWYIAQRETELGFLIDVRSIIRILNHLAESEKIKLYQYCFAYGSCVRVSHFMILRLEDQELMEQIHQHMIMRTLFDSYGRFPIDLKKDVRIESCLDEDGKISRRTLSEIKDDFKETNYSWKETKNFDDFRESIPAYRPSLAMHLYGCGRSSKLEKMFELYRFLFYLLVGDSDQSSSRPWLNRLPKFLSKFPNNGQFSQADFLPYMPVTVLRNCLSIRHEVPGLEVLLDDPVQQNLMLHEMPPKIRSQLFFSRKLHLDLRDVLTSLTYFRLLDHQHNFKFREYQKFQYKLNTKIELKKGASETVQFIFNNVADFDQFTQLVYNHLLEFRTECTDCPFDQRLNLHLINLNSRFFKKLSRKNPPEEDETQSLPKNKKHRAKRKPQQLKQTKNKRIKLEMKNRKNHHHPVNNAKTSSKKWTKKRKGISRRVRWSKNEDQFLLKCRLLSVLFGVSPGAKFAIPLNYISDLLRRNLGPKSSDKNPSTCARRILSMMKKPPIKRVLRVCLLELKREFPDPLNEENWDRDSPEQMKKFEKYLQQLLTYRFVNTEFFMTKQELMDNVLKSDSEPKKSANQSVDMETLLSMNEIINPYVEEICGYYMDPKNYYDIHSYVITNVLMSALISFHLHSDPEQTEETTKLRRCFMRTIFKTLKHFPDNLVLLVIKRLIKFRFITHKKKNNKDEKKLHPYAYKLGAVFFNDLAQHNLTYDLKYKQQVVRIKEENVCETVIEVDNSLIGAMEFGENLCVNILGLNKNTEDMNVMEKINGLNPDEPLLYPATMLDEIDFPIEIPNNFICLSKDVLETNRKKCRGLLMNRNSQLGDLLIEENLDRSKTKTPLIDNMSVIHCKVRIKQQVRLGRPIFSQRFFNLFAIHLQSFCTEEIVSESEENQSNQPQKIFTPEILAELTQEYSKNIAIPFNVEKKFPDLIEFIQSKKELGATMDMLLDYLLQPLQEIDRQSMANSLEEFLLFSCQKIKLIFRVGIITKLWVHKQYIRFWLVHSFKNLDLDEDHLSTLDRSSFKRIKKIYFLPKLWKSPDGQIDLKILFLFLNRLIAFLTTESGIATCLNRIENYFQQFLPKVQLEELLELLLAIDCVRITNKTDDVDSTEDSTPPCSINSFDDFFRNPCQSSSGDDRVRKPVASKNPSSDFLYEANVDAFSRLASLHKILAKLYDF